jgi:HD-like signal output (HDOD) protein
MAVTAHTGRNTPLGSTCGQTRRKPLQEHCMLTQPHTSIDQWTAHFRDLDIPVLATTVEAIAALSPDDDRVDANQIASIVLRDPLMTLRVLAHVSRRFGSRLETDVETVRAALVLMGIRPFFQDFSPLTTVQQRLGNDAVPLAAVERAVERAWRAARMALGFAVHRMDDDADVIHQAALLHDFSGLLLWCEAPVLSNDIARRQLADPTLRSAQAQVEVLHIELEALELALMTAWKLPAMLRQMSDPTFATHPGVRSVALAVRIARHTQHGWDNPALPDDFTELGQLLHLSRPAARELARELDS